MFTSAQYRTKALAYGALAKTAATPDQTRELQRLAQSFTVLAQNEQWLADNHQSTISGVRDHAETSIAADEHVLRCLGAALIMQWDTLPKKLQRELFDDAGAMGELLQTPALRSQIARFLHTHSAEGSGASPEHPQ